MSGSTIVLDRALAKMFSLNDSLVLNQEEFDTKVNDLFNKRAVKDGIRTYLASHGTSPRVMALLLYSTRGREHLRDMVENHGMPSSRLYDPLIFDGHSWLKVNAPLPIHEDIASGGHQWDFKAHEWMDKVDRLTAFPGVIAAMIDRFRRAGRMDQVFRHMRVAVIADLLEHEPAIFAAEVAKVDKSMKALINEKNQHHDLAVCLVRTFLDKTEAIGKLLGSKPIQRD
ncbi:hypothetical protein [Pseudomonas putida]|uniref:Uncharacterized protein n=1 Tax=Pseudomonas putida TaxID=303 RepID=A0A8I1ECI3_PSEPU|nr:hypothetical protein [Pseudomonas putida]MBI6882842.1 hypothetical protein [Pseudomonas putida]